MKAEIIFIGSELLRGKENSDAAYLGSKMDALGIKSEFFTVADNEEEILEILQFAFLRGNFVITVGGLGPTFDDRTVSAVSKFTGRKRVLSRETLRNVADYFIRAGVDMPKSAERQAFVLKGAEIFQNDVGTAPAQVVDFKKTEIILLPGPPAELKFFFEKYILARMLKKLPSSFLKKKKLHIIGLTESEVEEKIKSIVDVEKFSGLEVDFTILAHKAIVDVEFRLKGDNEVILDERALLLEKEFRDALGKYVYGADGKSLAYACGSLLARKSQTLSVAESCTGGRIADLITSVKGASSFFDMDVITYTEREKCLVLGIPEEEIKKAGVVSETTAVLMAEGLLKLSGSHFALSTTGVAGPGPSQGVKQGVVFIALAEAGGKSVCRKFEFGGSRSDIKEKASLYALNMLREQLL
ncbi:MAG: CinA family nicotinamide mononucleotide deamidase-related protein [bacterium]